MLRPLLPLALLLSAVPAVATTVSVHAPCADGEAAHAEIDAAGMSVGAATTQVLDAAGVEYVGSAAGISSILGTPQGDAALEVVDDDTMRAYGWCYEVDGVQPSAMPDAVVLSGREQRVHWFFGYATYDQGEWREYCTPVHETRPAFVCGGNKEREERLDRMFECTVTSSEGRVTLGDAPLVKLHAAHDEVLFDFFRIAWGTGQPFSYHGATRTRENDDVAVYKNWEFLVSIDKHDWTVEIDWQNGMGKVRLACGGD